MPYHFTTEPDCRIGDSICAVPIMLHLAKQSGEIATVSHHFNKWVWESLGVDEYLRIADAALGAQIIDVGPQRSWHHCNATGWNQHMAEGHFSVNGQPTGNAFALPIKKPKVSHMTNFAGCVLLAPYTTTDHNGNKLWPIAKWKELIGRLPPHKVFVLGAKTDDAYEYGAAGAFPYKGWSMSTVAEALKQCACFVSVDTGIGHLAVMLNMRNHIMLYGHGLPRKFAETPFGTNLIGNQPADISVDEVHSYVLTYIS